jgi:hypothetical protein
MKDALTRLIENQLKTYCDQPARMISDYNRERQLMGEYNGRQILEMLQNADDEGSDAVQIRLDEQKGILTIANRGDPFTVAGFESLMLANLSSKTKVKYIGNKGLGFRSIINWAHEITIDSGTVSVTFSESIARRTFEQLFDDEHRSRILQERNLSALAVPVAFLAVPEFTDRATDDWVTEIVIHYRPEFLAGIREQLASLQAECLLFLRHINTIIIEQDGSDTRLQRERDGDTVTIGADRWTIHADEARLPDDYQNADKAEEEWYSLKLAVADGLRKGASVLYTFFPTQVNIDFPMVVHGTFDLDSSRNQLIQSERNKFLLYRLVRLITATARELQERETDPWIQVRLLCYRDRNPVLKELDFYRQIDQALLQLKVFPCVDGCYRKASEVYYLGDGFSELVLLTGCGAAFPGLVYPGTENTDHCTKYQPPPPSARLVAAVNQLSVQLLDHDLEHRVALIGILCNNAQLAGRYSLLVNEQEALIDADTDAYTPRTAGDVSFPMPPFVNIDFISQRLFTRLAALFSSISSEKARDVQRKLKSITTIHSYEPAQIIRSIIRGAAAELRRQDAEAPEIIGAMVTALLANFGAGELAALPADTSVLLLNADLDVVDARELFLSRSYPTGANTERLFAPVYRPDQFLAPPSAFGATVMAADPVLLERLFVWLGVNRFVRYLPVRDVASLHRYASHVLGVVGYPLSYRDHHIICSTVPDADLTKMLGAMTKEELVEWLIRDPDARARLGHENPDKFYYSQVNQRSGSYQHELSRKPSYLQFQLSKAALFDHYVLDREVPAADLVNPFVFHFAAPRLAESGATRRDIENVLVQLGAKEQFHELPLEAVAAILSRLPASDPRGARTQRLYRLARHHYAVNGQALPPDVPLFAYRGEEGRYYPQRKVYYCDNIRLPRKIVNGHPMLDYPRRGGAKVVPAFFGVNSLSDLAIQVDAHVQLPALTKAMAAALREKLPFMLAYRIHSLHSGRAAEAARLARLAVVLCSELTCQVGGESFPLAVNDYVQEGTTYLVKVDTSASLADLARDPHFCDTFADIIAAVFTVGEHWTEIRGVFKDPLSEVQHLAHNALGDDTVRDARQLLGLADPATAFWAAVWGVRSGKAAEDFPPGAIDVLLGELAHHGVQTVDIDFERLSATDNSAQLKAIFDALHVRPATFNQVALYKLDFTEHHSRILADRLHQSFGAFRYGLWKRLDSQDWSQRGRFLDMVAEFEDTAWIGEVTAQHREDLDLDYDAIITSRTKASFGILDLSEPQDHEVFYRQQSGEYAADQLASLSAGARSLLYFAGGLARVREQAAAALHTPPAQPGGPALAKQLPAASSVPVAAHPTVPAGARPVGSSRFNPSQDTSNRISGERAEHIVIASLVAQYGAPYVEHVAHRRDGAGYDLRYSPDKGATWRYAEVKRYTQNQIYLSSNERAFALKHRDSYELLLVSAEDEIFRLVDIDFSDQDRFDIEPSEFVVSFTLNHNQVETTGAAPAALAARTHLAAA